MALRHRLSNFLFLFTLRKEFETDGIWLCVRFEKSPNFHCPNDFDNNWILNKGTIFYFPKPNPSNFLVRRTAISNIPIRRHQFQTENF